MITALVKGWRVRQIFKRKEVVNRINQIAEFDRELLTCDRSLLGAILQSKHSSKTRLIDLVHKMELRGLWLTYSIHEVPERQEHASDELVSEAFYQAPSLSSRSLLRSPRQTDLPSATSTKLKRTKTQKVAPSESAFSIKSNNQIDYTFENESYKSKAKEALQRRMQYNPAKTLKNAGADSKGKTLNKIVRSQTMKLPAVKEEIEESKEVTVQPKFSFESRIPKPSESTK